MAYGESNGHVTVVKLVIPIRAISRKQLEMLFSNNCKLLPSLL